MKFRAIGFDWGGVLAGQPGLHSDISKILGLSLEQFGKVFFQYNKMGNLEGFPYEELWRIVLNKLGKQDKSQEVFQYLSIVHKFPNRKVIALVDRLRNVGYKVGLLSNNNLEGGAQMRQEGLDKHFDAFLISAEIGFQKPEPEAFNLLIQKLNVAPGELIFVDDTQHSLSLAGKVGFYPILFKDYGALLEKLIALGVLAE